LAVDGKPENKDLARKEEPTVAPTPDKLDRSPRGRARRSDDDDGGSSSSLRGRTGAAKPYPLTEEEATPNVPQSERTTRVGLQSAKPSAAANKSQKNPRKRHEREDTVSDYNKFVAHQRTR
jgi:hypothetical protein